MHLQPVPNLSLVVDSSLSVCPIYNDTSIWPGFILDAVTIDCTGYKVFGLYSVNVPAMAVAITKALTLQCLVAVKAHRNVLKCFPEFVNKVTDKAFPPPSLPQSLGLHVPNAQGHLRHGSGRPALQGARQDQ